MDGFEARLRAVSGSVVDEDDLAGAVIQLFDRFQTLQRVLQAVPIEDDDEDTW
jgi:hypothetical protein